MRISLDDTVAEVRAIELFIPYDMLPVLRSAVSALALTTVVGTNDLNFSSSPQVLAGHPSSG